MSIGPNFAIRLSTAFFSLACILAGCGSHSGSDQTQGSAPAATDMRQPVLEQPAQRPEKATPKEDIEALQIG